ncbi:MAG: hypothetical protein CMN55_16350 [Sneathiella sp.]|uniref:hypothetical protein n=1 Tax=Sneathiella sp. TaxID=1964365 RepID=UPI000C62882C|nr:hypothetical protein [Sneathiella sp.]MAL80649.1 hypothetical protein [Sneathiella sp.]
MKLLLACFMCVSLTLTSTPLSAGEADVIDVKVVKVDADVYRFSVTVQHKDEGWEHYVDRWDILDMQGNMLGSRTIMHPHDNEQPFTRSMTLSLPLHVEKVRIRAHDTAHGYGGAEMEVALPE